MEHFGGQEVSCVVGGRNPACTDYFYESKKVDNPRILSYRCKKLVLVLLVTLLAAHTTKTFVRNYDWLDEYSIFMSGLKVNERNAKLFNNVGHALESQGRFKEALNFFNMAVQVQGDDIGAHINVGRTYNHLKMFKEAEDAYLKVSIIKRKRAICKLIS